MNSRGVYVQPPRRPVKLNKYVVPTDKKRQSLRWEIRHQMAQQLLFQFSHEYANILFFTLATGRIHNGDFRKQKKWYKNKSHTVVFLYLRIAASGSAKQYILICSNCYRLPPSIEPQLVHQGQGSQDDWNGHNQPDLPQPSSTQWPQHPHQLPGISGQSHVHIYSYMYNLNAPVLLTGVHVGHLGGLWLFADLSQEHPQLGSEHQSEHQVKA